jgi:acyl-CoA synthetase (AMP-forming)/AMP-acid ligase II
VTNTDGIINIANHLKHMAKAQPYKRAVVSPSGMDKHGRITYAHLTFQQLEKESDCMAHGLVKAGITRGTRTILMVKPSLEFFALTFALFKTGAVPVVVDPGMGIRRMISCFKESRPSAFIGVPAAHVLRKFYPKFFRSIKTWVTIGRRWFWRGLTLKDIHLKPWKPYPVCATRYDETAAILFTTGSTGPAKGVIYTHQTFDSQIQSIKSHFNITSEDIDLPTFPLFSLFDPALGMTAIIPDMDPTKPAFVNPEKIIEAINNHGVTNMFASPALLNRVGNYCTQKGITLPSIKRVVSAGAPVSFKSVKQFASILSDDAQIHTPYGATEAMPVLSISSKEILSETGKKSEQGFGMCVGVPLENVNVNIIKISDGPINTWTKDLVLPNGETGEIVVKGNIVTKQYFEKPKADLLAKIKEKNETWHRMGDLGWMDKKGRVWCCGRKNQRVVLNSKTLFTIPCESIFNNHPAVKRSALVKAGNGGEPKPVICIELEKHYKLKKKKALKKELLALAADNELTKDIKTVLFHKRFPVDVRHNSKIFREKLTVWANKKIK